MRTLYVAIYIIPAIGCNSGDDQRSLSDVFGGKVNLEIVRSAGSGKRWRLGTEAEEGLRAPQFHRERGVEDYPILSGPDDIENALLTELRDCLLDRSCYLFDGDLACVPEYAYRVQYSSRDGDVDILFCPGCDVLLVYRDGSYVGGGAYNRGIGPALQQIFPDDGGSQLATPDYQVQD